MRNAQVKNGKTLDLRAHVAVENLVEIIARLGAVLANETIYLRQLKISNITALQKEKEELTALLEKAKRQIDSDIDLANNFTPQERQELETVGRIFSEIAAENYRELKKAREVNRRVIGCISAAATDYFANQRGYNRKGNNGGMAKKQDILPPLSVNSVI